MNKVPKGETKMMKFYADCTELSERDISAKSMKRLRFLTYLSLPFTPFVGMLDSGFVVDSPLEIPLVILFLISCVALIVLAFSKLLNRVWVRDQYLDEWELQMKHRTLAFVLQLVVWTTAVVLVAGVLLDMFGLPILPQLSPLVIGYGLFSLLMLSLYAQVFVQIAIVQPIEQDELDEQSAVRRPIKGVSTVLGILIAMFIALPLTFGLISDGKSALEISTFSKEAKQTCEARGSRVHWVSIDTSNYGYACFDESSPSPEHLSGKETE